MDNSNNFKRIRRVVWVLLAVLLSSSPGTPALFATATAADQSEPDPILEELVARAGSAGSVRVIVELDVVARPEGLLPDHDAVIAQRDRIRFAQERTLDNLRGHFVTRIRQHARLPYLTLELDAPALEAVASDPDVVAVHEDRLNRATLSESTVLVGATSAAASGFGGAGQVVAVLDTGVDATHPFLVGKFVHQACFSSTVGVFGASTLCPNGLDSQIGGNAALPCLVSGCNHGTHVMGIAVGSGATFDGVAPDASAMAVQVFSRFDGTVCTDFGLASPCILSFTSDQIAALEHVHDQRTNFNIAAVNMSLGGERHTSACDGDPMRSAIDMLRADGIATVVSSGNDGFVDAISAPACISSAISVGSTTKSDQVSGFSNSAPMLDLLAPGSSIFSSVPGGSFATFSGTSMAAPHVAGAIAAIRSAAPAATVDEVLAALTSTGAPILDPGNNLTKPRIQVDAAVDEIRAVVGGGGELIVTPGVDLVALGPIGGPFMPLDRTYTLSNPGTSDIAFSVVPGATWVGATPENGMLSPGTSASVTLSIDASANVLAVGDYSASVAFTNTTDGNGSTSRSAFLTVTDVATNDAFIDAITLTTSSGTTLGSSLGAGKEVGEPDHAGKLGGRSVWWQWTATDDGEITIDTVGTGFDTLLAAYTGSTVAALTEVAGDDNAVGLQSRITFSASAGSTYYIAVDGVGGANGIFILNWDFVLDSTPTGDITVMPGLGLVAEGPVGGPFTPSATTYTLSNITSAAQSFTVASVPSWLTSSVSAGALSPAESTDITLSVDTSADSLALGDYSANVMIAGASRSMLLRVTNTASANDHFVNATEIAQFPASLAGSNVGATAELGEPDHAGNAGNRSVWWKWTSTDARNVTVDTSGSAFDTTLAIYTGIAVDSLTPVASNDDDLGGAQSRTSFPVAAGTTYYIAVDGFDGDTGAIRMNLDMRTLSVPFDHATIQEAIDAAVDGDKVLVGPGLYDENIDFLGKAITVTSEHGPEATIIDGGGRATNAVATFINGEAPASVLNGFTIQKGAEGGVEISGSSPTITNNIIQNNRKPGSGVGVSLRSSSSIVQGNLIRNNDRGPGSGGAGGGVYVVAVSSVQIIDNVIVDNLWGGGIYLFAAGTPVIRGNVISRNTDGGIDMVNQSDALIADNLIVRNDGIGVEWAVPSGGRGPLLVNNTIADNVNAQGYQVLADGFDDEARLVNNVIVARAGETAVFCTFAFGTERPVFEFNNIFAPGGIAYDGDCADQTGISGNSSADPLFWDSPADDYRLGDGSSSIDAGDDTIPELSSEDLDGVDRVLDGDGDTVPAVDLGAYEANSAGVLEFSTRSYSVSEHEESTVIAVSRKGGDNGDVSVDYATSDGTASAGQDYAATMATMAFANGESGEKTFTVPVINDSIEEGDETVNLSLANVVGGASLARTRNAVLVVTEEFVDLVLTMTESVDPVVVGDTLVYTISVENTGLLTANDVTVTDNLSGTVTLDSVVSSQGTCAGTATVVCSLGPLASGEIATITIDVTPNSIGTLDNTADVTATESDLQPSDNSASVSTTVQDVPPALAPADYFPLDPGLIWSYLVDNLSIVTLRTLDTKVSVDGVPTTPVESNDGFTDYYTSNNVDGVHYYRNDAFDPSRGLADTLVFTPAIKLAEGGIVVGQVSNSNGIATFNLNELGVHTLEYEATSTVETIETVTVPLGTYETVRIRTSIRIFGFILGVPFDITQVNTQWLAENVGPVKQLLDVDGVTSVMELTGVAPTITSPVPGSTLTSTSETFTWQSNGTAVQEYWLVVGTSVGAQDLYVAGPLDPGTLSHTVTGLPASGEALFVRLYSKVGGVFVSTDAQYTAFSAPRPAITAPTPGSTLAGASQTFTWQSNGTVVQEYWLVVGTRLGAQDVYVAGPLDPGTLSHTATGLPASGEALFVRLYSQVGGVFLSTDAQYTAFSAPRPAITAPAPGSTLTGNSETFTWQTNGAMAQEYWLVVGTSVGAQDVYVAGPLDSGTLSHKATSLPASGVALFVRLYSKVGGVFVSTDAQYTAFSAPRPEITDPTPGSTLTGISETFTWQSNGTAVQEYWLVVGTRLGAQDLYVAGPLDPATLSHTATGLPGSGETLFVRLYSKVGGGFVSTDAQYTAFSAPRPAITDPTPGSMLTGTSETFTWQTNGAVVQECWLVVGTSLGAQDLYVAGPLDPGTLSHTATGLPGNGETLFVRLYCQVGGVFLFTDAQYTATSP